MSFVQYGDIFNSVIVRMTLVGIVMIPSVILAILAMRKRDNKKILHDTALKIGMIGPNQKLF